MRFYRIVVAEIIVGVLSIIMTGVPLCAQDKPKDQQEIISVEGRLVLEPSKKGTRLVLYGKDRKVYVIRGHFRELLKSLLPDLGENNLVSLTGVLREGYDITCKTKFGFGQHGEKTLDTQCIRYYHLGVTQINDAKKSDEKIPPPERDTAQETKARQSALALMQQEKKSDLIIRSIQGKIRSLNLRSPIKTIEIRYRTEKNKPVDKVLLLTAETRVVKQIAEMEKPLFLDFDSLKVGQEVYVEYSEDEYTPEALFITIMK